MSKRKMSALWSSSSAESGILRKHDYKEKPEELLVFGYACKLFRDDEKAKEIDQGKHLIPWMGDSSLKIDRYDGRGALSDLYPYEASKEGYDATRWLGLNDSERKIEQLCDEERYYAMHINEEEDELYKEEELKRTQSSTHQFNYNYDNETAENKLDNSMGPTLPTEEEDEPFVAPPELDVPVNMSLPKTVKQNARIEKTALFISQQGPQMEILLKTKQAANPQFGFLTQDDALYRYYRHMVMAFKTGRYKMKSEELKNENIEKDEEHYLHPSLAAFSSQNNFSVPTVQTTIPYKPTTDCAYSKLINKIRGTYSQAQENPPAAASTAPDQQQQISLYNQQYLQFYQQYGYYPQYYQGQGQSGPNFEQQYSFPTNANNAYSQIVSNVTQKAEKSIEGQSINNGEISKAPILYKSTDSDEKTAGCKPPTTQQKLPPTLLQNSQHEPQTTQAYQPPKPSPQASLFVLTEYSGSESENEDEITDAVAVVIPPQEQQIIIDKMAVYVAKNGTDFENIVKLKGDPRFIFLENSHVYHPYYKFKLKENGGGDVKKEEAEKKATVEVIEKNVVVKESSSPKKEVAKQKHNEEKVERRSKQKEKKIITPVSFSIKKPAKDSDSKTRDRSALPLEDSSEEDVDKDEEEKEETSSSQGNKESNENSTNNSNIIEIEDPIMELIDLTDEFEEKKDRRAEDKLKDKIVLAAREKLAAKNRALQMERKKRALAFINQLKPQNPTQGEKMDTEEIKIIRAATPEEGEISEIFASIEDVSQTVYHIQKPKSPRTDKDGAKSPAEADKERNRSRSRSKSRYKSSKHHKKNQKRSHSRTRKRKREKKSHDHKKSKRRHHSRSRSGSRHRKDEKKDHSTIDIKRNRKKSPENSSNSNDSDIEIAK